MARGKKKVVLLIVEGESDETLLIERLRELYRHHEIRFEPQHGDILYDLNRQPMKPIKEILGDIVKKVFIKRKFKPSDILAVIHIIDTDGCLISNDNIVIDNSQAVSTLYQDDVISVPTQAQKQNIVTRNETRGRNISCLKSVNSIVSNKYPYQIYYFSRNLEHVVFNEPNPCSEAKCENVEIFLEELTVPLEEFLKEFMPVTKETYEDRFKESWDYISQGTNSLKRSTNVPLIIEYINLFQIDN